MGFSITVIGGGVSGCATALELANAGYNATLIESKDSLLSGSSDATPCRLGLGFHYMDETTAINYLHATLGVVKKYPGFKITDKNEFKSADYLRHGRYFIIKDTFFSLTKVLKLYNRLQQEYYNLCQQSSSNQVFGQPEKFYRILHPSEFSNEIDASKILLGIETAETIFNWPDFKNKFFQLVASNPNITLKTSTDVINVKHNNNSQGFVLTMKNRKTNQIMRSSTNIVINATWHNIEAINHELGFYMPRESRTNRLKVIVEIVIPKNLQYKNSMFFCFGPHCSFTNFGHGKGFITYEPVTNIESSTDLHISPLAKRYLSGQATTTEKREFGIKIIAGVSKYIPEMCDAEFVDARFGVVKTFGKVDIYSANSEFHKRRESGVQEKQIGWIDNACMKLLYFSENAISTTNLVKKHIAALAMIKKITDNLSTSRKLIQSSA